MDKGTYKTAVAIIPPVNLWEQIQDIRQKHDRHFRRWMPHINLIYPFKPHSCFDNLALIFSNLCKTISPFLIKFKNFSYFNHKKENFTIWLKPEDDGNLIKLQEILVSAVHECDDINNLNNCFVPHMSVGQIHGKTNMLNLTKELENSWKALQFIMDEINLIWRKDSPEDVFNVSYKIKLGNGAIKKYEAFTTS